MIIRIIKYIFFGLLQGFTEPLPISSSGHLYLARYLFNTDAFSDLNFEIVLNFASFIAIFYIFRKDIISLIKSFFTYIFNKEKRNNKKIKEEFKYALLVIVGSIPAGIVGVLFKDQIEALISPKLLGVSFLITALLLYFVRSKEGTKKDNEITYMDALIVGLFEMAALMPGISRSGACIVGALLVKMKRDTALKYAFMLYLPVSIGSFIFSVSDLATLESNLILPYVLGFIASMVMTYFASLWFFDIVKKGKLAKFSIYLVILGILVLLFV